MPAFCHRKCKKCYKKYHKNGGAAKIFDQLYLHGTAPVTAKLITQMLTKGLISNKLSKKTRKIIKNLLKKKHKERNIYKKK